MKQNNWLNMQKSCKDTIDLQFDSYYAHLCTKGFETFSNVLRYRNPSIPTLSVVHGPNSDHDPLSRLYVVLEL